MDNRRTRKTGIPSKKVLVIAHHFPPAGGVGTFRVAKFVKYLPEFGWKSAVVTTVESEYAYLDRGLEGNVPADTRIYRLPHCRVPLITDAGIRWAPRVLRSIRRVLRQENPDVVYITGGPFFPFILGPIIKRCFGIPYVMDLRDPWKLADEDVACRRTTRLHPGRLLPVLLEPVAVRHASRVICAGELMCHTYVAAYSSQAGGKFITITNGFDPDDFESIQPVRFPGFTIVYTGKFRTAAGFRDPRTFFQALRKVNDDGLGVSFAHIGVREPEVEGLAQATGLGNHAVFLGPRPYAETLTYAKGADLLLMIGTGQKYEQTGKVFDYIACGRPIMALAPEDGAIAEVVKQIPFARLESRQDSTVIAGLVREAYEKPWTDDDSERNSGFTRSYHRSHLTYQLAMCLDEVVGETEGDTCLPGPLANSESASDEERQ